MRRKLSLFLDCSLWVSKQRLITCRNWASKQGLMTHSYWFSKHRFMTCSHGASKLILVTKVHYQNPRIFLIESQPTYTAEYNWRSQLVHALLNNLTTEGRKTLCVCMLGWRGEGRILHIKNMLWKGLPVYAKRKEQLKL